MELTKEVLYQIEDAWSEGSATPCCWAMKTLWEYAESVMNGEPLVIETPVEKILVKDAADFLHWKHHARYLSCKLTNSGLRLEILVDLLEKAIQHPILPTVEIHQLHADTSAHVRITFTRNTDRFAITLQGSENVESDWFNRILEIAAINIRPIQWQSGHIRDGADPECRLEIELIFPDQTAVLLRAAYVYI